MRVAVLVDAAFFLTRYKQIVTGGREHDGNAVAEALHRWACDHLQYDGTGTRSQAVELYRIFVYDCPPFRGKQFNPISRQTVDFGKSDLAKFRLAFHARLPQLRKVALRLGHLSEVKQWTIKPPVMAEMLAGKRDPKALTADDITIDVKQKGVDMRIGVDVASLAYKRLVDRIVLVAGDADFVPAAKLARREGVDFVLDSMHAHINAALYEHIDALVSMAPAPTAGANASQPPKGYSLTYTNTVPTTGAFTPVDPATLLRRIIDTFGPPGHRPARPQVGLQSTPPGPTQTPPSIDPFSGAT
jgi:uncharacterized LabA/DUF88 family protein